MPKKRRGGGGGDAAAEEPAEPAAPAKGSAGGATSGSAGGEEENLKVKLVVRIKKRNVRRVETLHPVAKTICHKVDKYFLNIFVTLLAVNSM
jgi:hypothetical protein